MVKLRVRQIYFDESQVEKLEPEYVPYFNETLTPFFENTLIRMLIENGRS